MTRVKKLHIAFDPVYAHPLPEGHRFPMAKYELIPGQLMYEGTIHADNLFQPLPCSDKDILLTHSPTYLQKLKEQSLSPREQRQIGFPQSSALTYRELVITQGTIDCCQFAFQNGVSMNVAGGTHHAFKDRGEGFCLLNDFAVAANFLLHHKLSEKILIIDLDVHQGNGTASIFQDEQGVFTFSMHGKNNYPFHKENSDMDIELQDGIKDPEYLALLEGSLQKISTQFDASFAFYLSGIDVLDTDKFGKLKLSLEGCKQRDAFVFNFLKQRNIPCVVAMGGGYSPHIKTIIEAHCNTFRLAKDIYELN
jgi:acetoin utilization deacetylase AcuC-like enzyme